MRRMREGVAVAADLIVCITSKEKHVCLVVVAEENQRMGKCIAICLTSYCSTGESTVASQPAWIPAQRSRVPGNAHARAHHCSAEWCWKPRLAVTQLLLIPGREADAGSAS